MPTKGGYWPRERLTSPDKTGRARAAALHAARPCDRCGMDYGGRGRVQRHHIDGDRLNNTGTNIAFLCVQHHKDAHRLLDGRMGGGPRPDVVLHMHGRAVALAWHAYLLSSQGYSIAEIAHRVGVHPSSVNRWFLKYNRELRWLAARLNLEAGIYDVSVERLDGGVLPNTSAAP